MVARSSQIVYEMAVHGLKARASQIVVEVAVRRSGGQARASQVVLEVLTTRVRRPMTLVYPQLPGLTYNWVRRPIWSTGMQTAASGREVRVGYWSQPLWEWELSYEYLPDYQGNGATASDLKTLMGFFLGNYGRLGGFFFQDPDDYMVVGGALSPGDGATKTFVFVRSYGLGASVAENVGGLIPLAPLNVYVNGTLMTQIATPGGPGDYSVDLTTPMSQKVTFVNPPAAGASITVDMQFYFYVRFKDDELDFEKFMNKLWDQKQVTIRSLRG